MRAAEEQRHTEPLRRAHRDVGALLAGADTSVSDSRSAATVVSMPRSRAAAISGAGCVRRRWHRGLEDDAEGVTVGQRRGQVG